MNRDKLELIIYNITTTNNWDKKCEILQGFVEVEEAEVKKLREQVKDYEACLQNLWDNELIPDDTDIWDEVKVLLEVD